MPGVRWTAGGVEEERRRLAADEQEQAVNLALARVARQPLGHAVVVPALAALARRRLDAVADYASARDDLRLRVARYELGHMGSCPDP